MKNLVTFILVSTCTVSSAYADRVIGITDGDTLTVLHNRTPIKVRLANVDSPEKSQSYGQVSKRSLSDLCYGKDALLNVQSTDRYGRTVAEVVCDGVNVNRVQVQRGMAWVYERYNKDRSLIAFQREAKAAKKGLWADPSPVPPWEFRRPDGNQVRSSPLDSELCVTGPRGGRYQIVDGKKQYGC